MRPEPRSLYFTAHQEDRPLFRPRPAPRSSNARRPPPGGVLIAVLLAAGVAAAPARAHGSRSPLEDEVKAAFLFNFARFVDWPAQAFRAPDAPLVVGVLGSGEFAATLERVTGGKEVQGRPFRVTALGAADPCGCHILFLTHEAAALMPQAAAANRDAPVLLVGESESQARRGAVINFYLDENRVRFEVNIGAAGRARLTISSRLLSLARIVEDGPAGG